ncbi:MAG: DNA polymerase Y family protein [Buchananella hordeovulneris]|nr:DNA polymerase Y family protein [Buchananella hordeovulneris]
MKTPEWGCVWVPDWPLAALRQETGLSPVSPAVLGRGGRVTAASLPARQAGVRAGMRLRNAHALCPGLEVCPDDAVRELRAFEAVVRDLDQVLSAMCLLRPGLVMFSLPGARRHAGGEARLAEAISAAVLDGTGHEVHVGGGAGVLTALLAARADCFVPAGKQGEFLRGYPLQVLALAESGAKELTEVFNNLGLVTLGDLAALPAPSVRDRFGEAGLRLHSLAGGQDTQLRALAGGGGDVVEVSVQPDEPIERADVAAFAARRLTQELLEALFVRGLSCVQLEIGAATSDGGQLQRTWAFPLQPGQAELTERVRWQLESWVSAPRPPGAQGGLSSLRLSAVQTCAAGVVQSGLWETSKRGREAANRSAARVQSLLGPAGVLVPAVAPGPDPRSRTHLLQWGQEGEKEKPGPWEGGVSAPAPSLLSPELLPVKLEDGQGRAVTVDEAGELSAPPEQIAVPAARHLLLRAGTHRVSGTSWPWQLVGQWWQEGGAPARSSLAVECADGPSFLLVWIRGRWFLDGVYD